MKDFR
jgi:CobQ-like glutamine amidotransferase family enzyme